jgi:hypothetical protein
MIKAILLLAVTALVCPASVVYDNTTSDTGFSIFYSEGYTQIGDQLQLTTSAPVSSLDAQFFNDGLDATLDATLAFYNVGSPVGSQIGGSFTVSDISIASNTSQTVTFADFGGLSVPADVIVALSVQKVSGGGDIGVNFFDPPTVGASDNTFFIANDGTGLAQASTYMDIDNVYFQVNSVPEPATLGMVLGSLIAVAYFKRRRAIIQWSSRS